MQVHAELQKLTKDDLLAFYVGKVVTSGKERKALVVSSTSQQHAEAFEVSDGHVLIADVSTEKARLQVVTPTSNSIAMSSKGAV